MTRGRPDKATAPDTPAQATAALARFVAGQPVDVAPVLRRYPRGADLALAVRAVLSLIDHGHWFAASCAELPVAVIRAVSAAAYGTPAHVFMQVAAPASLAAAPLRAAWRAGAEALGILADTTLPFEAAPRREALEHLAARPAILAAIQAVVARTPVVSLDMLAILAIDGGDASVDALVPHLAALAGRPDARLERLARLRPLARRCPPLDALFAEVGAAVVDYRKTSPVRALAARLDLPPTADGSLWFHFMPMHGHRVQGRVAVDSREERWLSIRISRVSDGTDRTEDRETVIDDRGIVRDDLGLGTCELAQLPAWLAAAAKTLRVSWGKFHLVSNVAPHERLLAWLSAPATK